MQRETGFCVECRDVTSYTLQKKLVKKMIRGEELTFEITCAICVFGKFVLNNSQMSGEKSLRSLVDMKMMDNPVLSVGKKL